MQARQSKVKWRIEKTCDEVYIGRIQEEKAKAVRLVKYKIDGGAPAFATSCLFIISLEPASSSSCYSAPGRHSPTRMTLSLARLSLRRRNTPAVAPFLLLPLLPLLLKALLSTIPL